MALTILILKRQFVSGQEYCVDERRIRLQSDINFGVSTERPLTRCPIPPLNHFLLFLLRFRCGVHGPIEDVPGTGERDFHLERGIVVGVASFNTSFAFGHVFRVWCLGNKCQGNTEIGRTKHMGEAQGIVPRGETLLYALRNTRSNWDLRGP